MILDAQFRFLDGDDYCLDAQCPLGDRDDGFFGPSFVFGTGKVLCGCPGTVFFI